MLGYVVPERAELRVREFELYSAYYCGICKSIEERYGQLPRMALNYDAVFLALVLSSLESGAERIEPLRCPVHPMKKRSVAGGQYGIDYAADIMLLLAYFKALDDRRDEGSAKGRAALLLLRRSYKKVMKSHPEKGIMIEDRLRSLAALEAEACPSIDRAAEPFAGLMGEVFAAERYESEPVVRDGLRSIGYHLGKWIYLIDALDDLEKDRISGSYNPILARMRETPAKDRAEEEERIRAMAERNLFLYLAGIADAWNGIRTGKNQDLIENIIYLGLHRKTEQVLRKGTETNAEPL